MFNISRFGPGIPGYYPETSHGPVSMPPVVEPQPNIDGKDLAPYRYGGPRIKHPKLIAKASSVGNKRQKNWLHAMPNEILLNVMDYLLGSELKSAALVSRRISQVAIPALYRRQTIVIGDREDDIKLPSKHTEYILSVKVDKTWKPAILKYLKHMQLPSVTKLTIIGHKDLDSRFVNSDLAEQLGYWFGPQIEELRIADVPLAAVQQILENMKVLRKLVIGCIANDSNRTMAEVLERTVAGTVQQLHFVIEPTEGIKDLSEASGLPASIGSRKKWPALKLVRYGNSGRDKLRSQWARTGDLDSTSPLPQFHVHLMNACNSHARWRFEVNDTHIIDIAHIHLLSAEEVVSLLEWLKPAGEDFINLNDTDKILMESLIRYPSLLSALLRKINTITSKVGGHRIRISGIYPLQFNEVLTALAMETLELEARAGDAWREVEWGVLPNAHSQLHDIFLDWNKVLKDYLSHCHKMHTFRICRDGEGRGVDINLIGLNPTLPDLCRTHALRHLDIDVSAVVQPETHAFAELEDWILPEEPHMAIKQLLWLSFADQTSTGRSDFRRNLLNLESFTLHGVFLRKQLEFIWFTNLTAKHKNLTSLRVHGLAWHAGHYKDNDWGYDETNIEDPDEWEDDESVSDDSDISFHRSTSPPPNPASGRSEIRFGPPRPPNHDNTTSSTSAGRQTTHTANPLGQTVEPEDEEDRQMNQILASFFLSPDFERITRQRLGLSETEAMNNAEYRALIASRDAMRGELEQRARDGTVRLQPNPFAPAPGGFQPTGADADYWRTGRKQNNGEEEEDDDTSSVISTDSKFGVDPRFADVVDEGLREQRLKEWVTKMLESCAKKTGGLCGQKRGQVFLEDVTVDARGKKPWFFRVRRDLRRRREKGELWSGKGVAVGY